jgi:biotin-(acetyl-CoA carboxylase) ligase
MVGQFESIDDAGRLLLRTGEGGLEAIAAGEVFPLDRTA